MSKSSNMAVSSIHRRGFSSRRALYGYAWTLPAVLCVIFFIFYPIFESARLSLTDQSLLAMETEYVGLETYRDMLTSEEFQVAFKHSVIWLIFGTLGVFVFGFLIGFFLHLDFIGSRLLTALVLLPWVIPDFVAATAWKWLTVGEFGIVSFYLEKMGFPEPSLLASSTYVLPTLILLVIWRITPLMSILVRASLESVPPEYYEAAEVDGATAWQRFIYITIPTIRYPLVIGTLLTSLFVLREFAVVWVTTQGGPVNYSEILPTFIYRQGFMYFETGPAAASSMIYFFFILTFALLYLFSFRRVWKELL